MRRDMVDMVKVQHPQQRHPHASGASQRLSRRSVWLACCCAIAIALGALGSVTAATQRAATQRAATQPRATQSTATQSEASSTSAAPAQPATMVAAPAGADLELTQDLTRIFSTSDLNERRFGPAHWIDNGAYLTLEPS